MLYEVITIHVAHGVDLAILGLEKVLHGARKPRLLYRAGERFRESRRLNYRHGKSMSGWKGCVKPFFRATLSVMKAKDTALIVIDTQQGVVEGAYRADRTVANVAAAVERARMAGVPVVWVQHEDEALAKGSEAWRLAGSLERNNFV